MLIAIVLCTYAASPDASHVIQVTSTLDGALQPCLFVPATGTDEPQPLLIGLHPWSHGFDTFAEMEMLRKQAGARGWHYLQPHFRGPNNQPEACASRLARQDILDAVDFVVAKWRIDQRRIYLAGVSGGAHMALVMASYAPERWTAVSAWCGITDLAAWHGESKELKRNYWKDIEACCGGAPGASEAVSREYEERSSLPRLARAKDLPIDIAAGINDGHTGSVPIHHSIDAFNVIAKARGDATVGLDVSMGLSKREPELLHGSTEPGFSRAIYLRMRTGGSRITIFEGGHEMLYQEACDWLAEHAKP